MVFSIVLEKSRVDLADNDRLGDSSRQIDKETTWKRRKQCSPSLSITPLLVDLTQNVLEDAARSVRTGSLWGLQCNGSESDKG